MPGPNARSGGGDWDSHAADLAGWVEPKPGERCAALLVGGYSLLEGEPYPKALEGRIGRLCTNMAPERLTICTPCHRRRLKIRHEAKALNHRLDIVMRKEEM